MIGRWVLALLFITCITLPGGSRDGTLPLALQGEMRHRGQTMLAAIEFHESADLGASASANCSLRGQRLKVDGATGTLTYGQRTMSIVATCKSLSSNDYEVIALGQGQRQANLVGKVKTTNWSTEFAGRMRIKIAGQSSKELAFTFD